MRTIRKSSKPDALTIPIFAMTANAFSEDVAAGNLSMTRLYTALVPLVDALRKNDLQQAQQLLPAVEEAYTAAVSAIL